MNARTRLLPYGDECPGVCHVPRGGPALRRIRAALRSERVLCFRRHVPGSSRRGRRMHRGELVRVRSSTAETSRRWALSSAARRRRVRPPTRTVGSISRVTASYVSRRSHAAKSAGTASSARTATSASRVREDHVAAHRAGPSITLRGRQRLRETDLTVENVSTPAFRRVSPCPRKVDAARHIAQRICTAFVPTTASLEPVFVRASRTRAARSVTVTGLGSV